MINKMVKEIQAAINSCNSINIQMDVTRDWNRINLVIYPTRVGKIDDDFDKYIYISTDIGDIYIDTMEVAYDADDACYVCSGVSSNTFVFC